jgi:hypothetical protein
MATPCSGKNTLLAAFIGVFDYLYFLTVENVILAKAHVGEKTLLAEIIGVFTLLFLDGEGKPRRFSTEIQNSRSVGDMSKSRIQISRNHWGF